MNKARQFLVQIAQLEWLEWFKQENLVNKNKLVELALARFIKRLDEDETLLATLKEYQAPKRLGSIYPGYYAVQFYISVGTFYDIMELSIKHDVPKSWVVEKALEELMKLGNEVILRDFAGELITEGVAQELKRHRERG